MGQHMRLVASDGHKLGAYRSDPVGQPRGGIVVLQEIFGVNGHIRSVTDRLAEAGYIAIAPALFDRFAPNHETGYSQPEIEAGRKLLGSFDWEDALLDTRAAQEAIAAEAGPVSIMGFCVGGSLAFLAATRFADLACVVSFYGGQIVRFAEHKPLSPVQMHFGETDRSIPLADVEAIRAKRPEAETHVYPAGHGFNCDARASYEPHSAATAWQRSLDFIGRN